MINEELQEQIESEVREEFEELLTTRFGTDCRKPTTTTLERHPDLRPKPARLLRHQVDPFWPDELFSLAERCARLEEKLAT